MKAGDTATVKACTIENLFGSWIITYEKVENAIANDDTITYQTTVITSTTQAQTTTVTTVTTVLKPLTQKNGFDEKTNMHVNFGGLIWQIPNYFKPVKDKITEDHLEFSVNNSYSIKWDTKLKIDKEETTWSIEQFEENKDLLQKEIVNKENGELQDTFNIIEGDSKDITLIEMPCRIFEYRKNSREHGCTLVVFNPDSKQIIRITLIEPSKEALSISDDFIKIMETVVKSNGQGANPPASSDVESSSEKTPEEIQSAVQNGDYSLVTPEFKATMDAYEKFYDDYIAFMKKYNSGTGDTMAMLNDYMTMVSDMEKWTKKIDAIDESKLSPADDAYYLLVTLRIEKKLLNAM